MAYFDDEAHVQEYIKMADGFDGKEFVEKLGQYLSEGVTILELGMGPGKDLDMLSSDMWQPAPIHPTSSSIGTEQSTQMQI